MCEVTVYKTIPAPQGDKAAVVYMRDCGAATRFNTQVSIAGIRRKFDDSHYPSFVHVRGKHDITPVWTSENELRVNIPKDAEMVHQTEHVSGVKIVYR